MKRRIRKQPDRPMTEDEAFEEGFGVYPTVLMVRHGATDLNSTAKGERLRGWLDVPLNADGKAEAEKIAKDLAAGHGKLATIITSDLQRATYTAHRISELTRVRAHVTPELRPWNLGQAQGKPVDEYIPKLEEWVQHPEVRPPGGEPFAYFKARLLRFVKSQMQQAVQQPQVGARVLVTHTRCILLTRAWLAKGMDPGLAIDMEVFTDYDAELSTGEVLRIQLKQGHWEHKPMPGL